MNTIIGYTETDVRRLHSRIHKRQSDDCWYWTGKPDKNGYGRIKINNIDVKAHRFTFLLSTGIQPGELEVCHHCDAPPCNNPAHLFLGTHLLNTTDAVLKGRHISANPFRGETNGLAKLTEAQVLEIRFKRNMGYSYEMLAKDYKVNSGTIYNLVNHKSWKHVQ